MRHEIGCLGGEGKKLIRASVVTPYIGFSCQTCQAVENLAKENGCKEPMPKGENYEIGAYHGDRCPIALIREDQQAYAWLVQVHRSWDLRLSVPYTRAPAQLVEAWDEVSRARNALQEWYHEQAQESGQPKGNQEGHRPEGHEKAGQKANDRKRKVSK